MQHPVSFRVFAAVGFTLGLAGIGALVARLAQEDAPPNVAFAAVAPAPRTPAHAWRLVRGKHWQIEPTAWEPVEVTDAREQTGGACGAGMVQVRGRMKQDPPHEASRGATIEDLQKLTCTSWINREYPERCAVFDRERWLAMSASLETKPMHFCMDRFEYPNLAGQHPIIYVAWPEAQAMCEEQGKRLCTEDEWTFACEGEEAMPYPYGYVRDPSACAIDATWRPFNERAMQPRDGVLAMLEMDRLWQGQASGAMPRCKSPFGVYDMTGNVDEWTHTSRAGERPSILKGGYWGPVRTRCRPSTRSHDESHVFYQQGFRCCSEPPPAATAAEGQAAEPGTSPRALGPAPTTPPGGLMPPFDAGAVDIPPIESWTPAAPADAPEGG
jgi:hypothetical protein